ncbi:hypothetical protein BH09BAC2_BH09BAC2_00020 [soil metagenome]
MSEAEAIAAASKSVVGAVGQIIDIAKENPDARQAGANLAKTAKVVTEFISNLALPLAAGNFVIQRSADYFRHRFADRLAEKLADVDPEDLIEPKPMIAGPAIEGLNYAHDEPDLEDMFTSLIATAMDKKTASSAHPAFVHAISQMDPAEASLLKTVLRASFRSRTLAIAELRTGTKGWTVLERNLLRFTHRDTNEMIVIPGQSAWVDNWVRLGLVEVDWMSFLSAPDAYEWVKEHPLYLKHAGSNQGIHIAKGAHNVTDFGVRFARAIRLDKPYAVVVAESNEAQPSRPE